MRYNSFLLFLYLIFIIIENIKANSSTISLKFKKYISTKSDDILLSNYNNDIYITLYIGNPKQKMDKIFLKCDTYEFMIANSNLNKNNYNDSISSTSKLIQYAKYYTLKYTSKGSIFNDNFFLINNEDNNIISELKNISFIYANLIKNDIYTAVIGLELNEDGIKKVNPFPYQLKDNKYIKDTTWMIKYDSEDEGNFLIGEVLGDENFKNFNIDEYRKTNAIIYGRYLSWDLLFTRIEFNNIKITGTMQANLDFNLGLISCSNEYYNSIKNELFNKYISEGVCKELFYDNENKKYMNINSKFYYIVCDKSFKIKKFPEILFYHTELDFIFKLTYEDVFIITKDKIYFLCINEIKENVRWRFGKPFFKKYNIIFDHNLKTIGIYGNINKAKVNWVLIEWIIVIILFIAFILLGFTLIRRYRLNHYKSFEKKIKVDEMKDNFFEENYKEFNMNNKGGIKEENKIIDDK